MSERRAQLIVVVVVGLAYALLLPTTLTVCDAGEFVALAVGGGIAHPPGYPLYTMLLRLAALLVAPSGMPLVTGLAALSAGAVIVGAIVLLDALRPIVAPALRRAVAVIVVATTAPVWRAATDVEPFGVHLLLVSVVVWATIHGLYGDARRAPAILGAAFGLGLCHHHSLALLAPGAAVVVVAHARRDGLVRTGGAFAIAFAVGALPLGYFVAHTAFVVDEPLVRWGAWPHDARGLVAQLGHHLLRSDYGTTSLVQGATGAPSDGIAWWLSSLPLHLSLVWVFVVAAGLAAMARGRRRLALATALTGACLLWFFAQFRPPDPIPDGWRTVVERFFAMPLWCAAVPLALGLDRIALHLATTPRARRACVAGVVAACIAHVAHQATLLERRGAHTFEAALDDVAAGVPPHAVLLVNGDIGFSAGPYLRAARDVDVEPLQVSLWNSAWYREHVRKRIAPSSLLRREALPIDALVREALQQGRAVYTWGQLLPASVTTLQAVPHGPVWQVLPASVAPPSPLALYAQAVRESTSWRVPATLAHRAPTDWERLVLPPYEDGWRALVQPLRDGGHLAEAEDAQRRADEVLAWRTR